MDENGNIEELTEEQLMQEFMRLMDQTPRPTELTVNSFAETMEMPRDRARYLLYKYELRGVLKARKVRVGTSSVNAYSPAKGTWKDAVDLMKQELK